MSEAQDKKSHDLETRITVEEARRRLDVAIMDQIAASVSATLGSIEGKEPPLDELRELTGKRESAIDDLMAAVSVQEQRQIDDLKAQIAFDESQRNGLLVQAHRNGAKQALLMAKHRLSATGISFAPGNQIDALLSELADGNQASSSPLPPAPHDGAIMTEGHDRG